MNNALARPRCALALALIILLLMPMAFADVNVDITEGGKIISFYDQYYIYQINGTVTVTNPSNYTLYNIELPLYLSTLDVRTNYSTEDSYMVPNKIYIYALGPGGSQSFAYRILGITTEDLSTNQDAVLANGINAQQPRIYSNLFGTLKKADFENASITGHANTRLVSVELRNPTGFEYTVGKVEVIKTAGMDPNTPLNTWDFTSEKPVLHAREGWDFDFLDQNASEGEVYWLSTDIYIDKVFVNSSSNITRYDQEDLFEVISNATLNETLGENVSLLADRVYLRKLVSKTLVTPGDVVNVTVIINNFEPREATFLVTDPFPEGFEIISVDGGSNEGRNVTWNVTLSSGGGRRLHYALRYTDPDLLGVDYFRPAELVYNNKTYYSQTIPFVRNYIPQKRVFVQKNVKFLSGDEVQVTLSVRNLGETPLENLMLKEQLLSTAEFREISIPPMQRGMWKIESLNQSKVWETTYITDKMSVTNTLPDVYGVPQGSVLQTIILSNLIDSQFSILPVNIIEIVGIIALAIILLLYFVPPSFFSRARREQSRDLRVMSRELSALRQKTDHHNQDLAREERKGAEPVAAPAQPAHARRLDDPDRVARHQAVEQTGERLEEVKKELSEKKP